MGIAGIDVVFIVIIAISTLRCAARGFISEFLSMAALILGIVAAIIFYRSGAALVRGWFMPDIKLFPELIAFVSLFLLVYIIAKIVEITLKSIVEGIRLGSLDHLLGFILGFVEGLVVVCLFLFLMSIQPFFDAGRILDESIFAKIFMPLITGTKKEILESVVMADVRRIFFGV
ncbi:MAG: CvpA family protein [Treponema sp.]|jgi:membrane protein required for colicin V production|nr:CvpA family protein [Treponema sp.]